MGTSGIPLTDGPMYQADGLHVDDDPESCVSCYCVPTVKHTSSVLINCTVCVKGIQVACLANHYKQSGAAQSKSNTEWLRGFIVHAKLAYTCESCRSSATNIRNLQENFQATQMEQSNGNSNSKLAASENELYAKVDKISEHLY